MGSVTTGEPGSRAAVTNSGTSQAAVFNFVIPQGATGSAGTPDVLAAVDTPPQPSGANQALSFRNNALISGSSISHASNSPNITISSSGIYQVLFYSTVGVASGHTIPASVSVFLTNNGTTIQGSVGRHSFAASGELATVSFSIPVQVTTTPAVLNVVTDSAGFLFSDLSITVFRLGDADTTA